MTEWLMLGLSLLLVVGCGVFVAGEFALLTVDRPTVDDLARRGDRPAQGLQVAFHSLSTQLSGVQVAITLTNLAIGLLAEPAVSALLDGPLEAAGISGPAARTIAVAVALTASTLATMLLGELLPKNLAIAAPMAVARTVQGPVRGFTWLMHWPIRLLNSAAEALLRVVGLHTQEELASARSAQELASLVRHSADEGTLAPSTARLVVQSLRLKSHRAGEIMTPRPAMVTIAADATVAAFLEEAAASGRSRFPVVEADGTNEAVGVVDLDRAVHVPYARRATTTVRSVMAAPVTVPETLPAAAVLTIMQQSGVQLVIVIDEYGDTAGLITGEDVIEELVGELADEFEPAAEDAIRTGAGWEVSGLLRPDEIAEATGIALPDDGPFHTVAGLIADRLDRIPAVGDRLEIDGVQLTVSRMAKRRIDRIHLTVDHGTGDDQALGNTAGEDGTGGPAGGGDRS